MAARQRVRLSLDDQGEVEQIARSRPISKVVHLLGDHLRSRLDSPRPPLDLPLLPSCFGQVGRSHEIDLTFLELQVDERAVAPDGSGAVARVANFAGEQHERLVRNLDTQFVHTLRRLPGNSGPRPEKSIAPNILQRAFEADSPNKKWLAD